MAKARAKAPPKCNLRLGHAAEAHARADGIEQEIKRVNDQYEALLVERGPRCQHTARMHPDTVEQQTRIGEMNRSLQEALTDNTTLRDALTWKQRQKLGLEPE